MRLEFTRIILRDFKDYRGKHAIDLSGLGFGVHYIRGINRVDPLGSNGAGKSTLWDAFVWALTGRTTRGLRGTDVRPWHGAGAAMCRVDFYVGDKPHWIKRSTARNGLWLDGKLASQEEIERRVGLGAFNIAHTIVLGQKRDLFFDLKPDAKLKLLSETLQLDRWEARSSRARDAVRELEKSQGSIAGQRMVLNESVNDVLDMIERVKNKAAQWEEERATYTSDKEDRIAKLRKARERAITDKGTHDLAYDSAETELRALRRDLAKKQADRDKCVDGYTKARITYAARLTEYNDLKELSTSDTCPTCGQDLHNHKLMAKDAKWKLKGAKNTRDHAHDKVMVWEAQIEMLDKLIARMRKAEQSFADKSDAAKDKLDRGDKAVAEFDRELASLTAKVQEQENPYSHTLEEARANVKRMKREIVDMTTRWDKLELRITRTKYWVKGFKDIRLYLLQETLEELEEVTQSLLPEFGLAGWSVKYDIERETRSGDVSTGLSVKILKPKMSKAVRWESWSGGEGQRLLIVGAIALSQTLLRRAGIECDLLVLDEPTRHMSEEGVAETVDYLISHGRDAQIFYVDHQVVESNRFASVITVEKNDGGSKISIET